MDSDNVKDFLFLSGLKERYGNSTSEEAIVINKLIELCEKQLEHSVKLASELKEIREDSKRDALTGLYNKKEIIPFFKDILKSNNPMIRNSTFSIIAIDLDHFKSINDTYGHNVGDDILKIVAEGMIRYFKKSDLIVRDGGDEFLIVALNCSLDILNNRALQMSNFITNSIHKELLNKVDMYGNVIDRPFDYTVSFGIKEMDRSLLTDIDNDLELSNWIKEEKKLADAESFNMKNQHHAVRK